jgi:hypothetical protein
MASLLVVANRTLGCPELTGMLAARLESEPQAQVLILAPAHASEGRHQWDYPISDRNIPEPAQLGHELAAARLEAEMARLAGLGISVQGEVVDGDVVERVKQLATESHVDVVLVCTLPERVSHWLRIDLPQRITRAVTAPVVHIPGSVGPNPS